MASGRGGQPGTHRSGRTTSSTAYTRSRQAGASAGAVPQSANTPARTAAWERSLARAGMPPWVAQVPSAIRVRQERRMARRMARCSSLATPPETRPRSAAGSASPSPSPARLAYL